ncbi:alpha/beta fold hydrolase [Brevundimonas fluminis]|jgi:pimeloyl-[acyl-carrier protein] methyl ester esterase|uniref:alpha/beta fold hydrolase n=1 Tax=Brevundimonas fluminis TaxID=2487274 RepID=UPI000F657AF0|nr:alpha/beta hydrolase [Brevundimonas fluminis]
MFARLISLFAALVLTLPAAGLAQAQSFRSDRITVEARGRGPDVVLIPGLASTPVIWNRLADRLDDDHRVHLVSVRGFGTLPAAANGSGPLVGPVSQEVLRYIRSQGLRAPAVIGHSMGGLVALRVAADGGRQIGRVMVVDASPFFPGLVNGATSTRDVEPLARVAYQTVLLLGDEALRQGALGGTSDAVMTGMGWQGGDRRVLAQGLYEVMTLDMRHRLDELTAPVTVAYGWSRLEDSPRRDLERRLRPAFRGLRTPLTLEPIEGAEHMVMIDQPRRFEAAVLRFLR